MNEFALFVVVVVFGLCILLRRKKKKVSIKELERQSVKEHLKYRSRKKKVIASSIKTHTHKYI